MMPICGPFLSASAALHQLSENLYQHRLLNEVIEMYNEHEIKIKLAIENNDSSEYVATLQKESDYYDQIFEISIVNSLTLYEA